MRCFFFVDESVGWLIDRCVSWFVGRSVGQWIVCCLVSCLVGCFVVWYLGWLVDVLDCQVLVCLLIDRLINLLFNQLSANGAIYQKQSSLLDILPHPFSFYLSLVRDISPSSLTILRTAVSQHLASDDAILVSSNKTTVQDRENTARVNIFLDIPARE